MVLDSSHWVTGFGTWKAGEFQLNTNGTEAVGSLALPIPAYVISMSDKSVLCVCCACLVQRAICGGLWDRDACLLGVCLGETKGSLCVIVALWSS